MAERAKPKDINEYIAAFSPDVQTILQKIRSTIRKALPDASERIGYQMPAFTQDGDVIYFAAFKKHIGIYPPVHGDEQLMEEIARYRGEKGNLQFPLDEPGRVHVDDHVWTQDRIPWFDIKDELKRFPRNSSAVPTRAVDSDES